MYLKATCTFISVAVLVVSSLLPFLGLKRTVKSDFLTSKTGAVFNCFACGIFLATCFLGLFPHLQMNERAIRTKLNLTLTSEKDNSSFQSVIIDTNVVVLSGLLLIVLLDQLTKYCIPNGSSSHSSSAAKFSVKKRTEGVSLENADNQPLVELSDSESDGEDFGRIEFRSAEPEEDEHRGHSHNININMDSPLQAFLLVFALSIHSIFEGIALGAQASDEAFIKFMISVMLHEVLCSFAFGIKLAQQNISLKFAISLILFLSLSIPLGLLLMNCLTLLEAVTSMTLKFVLEGFAAGIFIYVALVEMLAPELNNDKWGFSKALGLIGGSFTFFLLNYIIQG